MAAGRGLKHALRRLHLWLGLSVGIAFALVALAGSVLAFEAPLLRQAYPQLDRHPLPDATRTAWVLARIERDWAGRGLRSTDLPRPRLPVWQLYFADGTRRYLDPLDGRLLLERRHDALAWIRDLHTHLLAGRAGERLAGLLGTLALALLLIGAVLWWPRRGHLGASLRWHVHPPTRRWASWHRSLGALTLPLLLVAMLTGIGMAWHASARALLRGLFADPPAPPRPAAVAVRDVPVDWAAVLGAARHALPGAALHRIALPGPLDAAVVVRAQAPGEWHPVGRSELRIDPYTARVLTVTDATRAATGARAANGLYPLHAGAVGGWAWRLLVAFAGVLPMFFLVTGFLFWRARRRRRTP